MKIVKLKYSFLLSALSVFAMNAQETNKKPADTIKTERLIIVKQYSPTVSDAFKVKQAPNTADFAQLQKKAIQYTINSFPVASTFQPQKGKAVGVQKKPQPKLYKNYAALGVGNYTNVMAKFYGEVDLKNKQSLAIGLNHNSSQGGIKDVLLDDKYYDTQLNIGYNKITDRYVWGLDLDVQHQLYNWYGTPNGLHHNMTLATKGGSTFQEIQDEAINLIDPKHTYLTVGVGGNIQNTNETAIFDKAKVYFRNFTDDYSSMENQLSVAPEFKFLIEEDSFIKTKVGLDYLSGSFDKGKLTYNPQGFLASVEEQKYSFFNLSVAPSYQLVNNDFALDIGLQAVLNLDNENSKTNFYVYPKVEASYAIAGDYFKLYAGAKGGLTQNTYYDFVQENPYVAPTLAIQPTDKPFDIFAGTKGKFTEDLSYDFQVSYNSENNAAMFVTNRYSALANLETAVVLDETAESYQYGNAFHVIYDDIKTLRVAGALNAKVNEDLLLRLSASYANYSLDTQEEYYNKPNLEASLTGSYQITDKWFADAQLFFYGERKDRIDRLHSEIVMGTFFEQKNVTLDAFIDANLKVGYKITPQLTAFVRGNNLLSDNYERWYNYPVQGIQVMGGLSYQFNW